MGKKKGGHKKRKTGAVELIADVFLVVDGGRRILTADYTTIGWHIKNGSSIKQILTDPAVRQKAIDSAIGVVEIVVGPKAVSVAKSKLPAPVKRMRIPGSSRTVL